jgi:hypothetical protein
LVKKLAPTVDVIWAGLKEPLQYRITRDVLPTFWAPRTTILASREDDMVAGLQYSYGQGKRGEEEEEEEVTIRLIGVKRKKK